MFRKSDSNPQLDLYGSVSSHLQGGSLRKYNDQRHWHNQFRTQVFSHIDEDLFKGLFHQTTGAPNASVSLLVGMMILKEAFGWSDAQLFEQCQFNLLTRSALGLVNMSDAAPAESTYYLLRKRMYEYNREHNVDLMAQTFERITSEQVLSFKVDGSHIRMDSKLIGSNIALFSRYEIIHTTLMGLYKSLKKKTLYPLGPVALKQLQEMAEEDPQKTVYRCTRHEINTRLHFLGEIIYRILRSGKSNDPAYLLMERVFNEQYKVLENKQVEIRPKEEISSGSVQSPHDPDSAYRHKKDQKVQGYSTNITETNKEGSLNLITSVQVEKANAPDVRFVRPAIEQTQKVTGQEVQKVYADGAYQSPDNDDICSGMDMVYTGMHGSKPRYDLNMTPFGLMVTDTLEGISIPAILAKKNKNSKEDRWGIDTPEGRIYFGQQAIRAAQLRRQLKNRTPEELNKRNNVEATIFQLSLHLRNGKSKYRSMFKQQLWACCRCLWINLVRIMNYSKQICQRTCAEVAAKASLSLLGQKKALLSSFHQYIISFFIVSCKFSLY